MICCWHGLPTAPDHDLPYLSSRLVSLLWACALTMERCLDAGMMDLKGAHEWVVTTKLGSSDVRPGTTPTVTRNCRMYAGEMAMSGFVLGAAFYGVFTVNRWTFSIFLFLQVRAPGDQDRRHYSSPAAELQRFMFCSVCAAVAHSRRVLRLQV